MESLSDSRHFKSQWGTDKIVNEIFSDQSGTFIEVGSHNGVSLSNTFYLEKMKDWTGLLVEPIPELVQESKHNRWCPVFQGCVSDFNGKADFLRIHGYSEMMSGLKDKIHPDIKQRINSEITFAQSAHKDGSTSYNCKTDLIEVECKTLNQLIQDYNLPQIDYLSLDTQSSELQVLKSYYCKKNPIKVISLDYNGVNSKELDDWFHKNNYTLIWKCPNSDEHVFKLKNNL